LRLNPWFAIPVVAAGVAGALIGRDIARVNCAPVDPEAVCDSGASEVILAVVGAVVAMVGVAVVIVLVIRSLAEWRESNHH
jgi:hypothetical protein